MNTRCKLGQQAIIINSLIQSNIGREVTVHSSIGRVERGGTFEYNGSKFTALITDHHWWITTPHGLDTNFGLTTSKSYIADSWLLPIEEPEDPDAIDTAEPTINTTQLETHE